MKRLIFAAIAALAVTTATSIAAQTRTWVSGVGDDLNPCSRTAPCKTFAGAIGKTAANGEINCLDPAGYGTVNITKNMTIDCGWTHGSILSSNTNGVIVNGSGIVVTLRGLTINGASTTTGNGVRIIQAAAVNIDDLVIENLGGTGTNGRGVTIETATSNVRVTVQNTRLFNVNNFGIDAAPTAGNVVLVVDNTQIERGASAGILLRSLTTGTINRTTVAHMGGAALSLQQSSASAHVSNSMFANNAFGVFNGELGGAPTTRLFGNVITGNTTGLSINGGSVISYGNNAIRGNTGNETPSSTQGPT